MVPNALSGDTLPAGGIEALLSLRGAGVASLVRRREEFPVVLYLVMHNEPRPTYVQAYAGRKRARYWRKLGFPNLVRARPRRAELRLEGSTGFPESGPTTFIVDLDPDHEASQSASRRADRFRSAVR